MRINLAAIFLLFFHYTSFGAVILQYHHVSDTTPKSTSITAAQFEVHLKYLEEHSFNVVPLSQIVEKIKTQQPLKNKTVVITFDDAYIDVLTQAKPLLDKYNYPYTIFVNPAIISRYSDNENAVKKGKISPYLSWSQLKALGDEGVIIANHGFEHDSMTRPTNNTTQVQWLTKQTELLLKAEDIIKLGDIELELIDPKAHLSNTNNKTIAHQNLSNSWIIHSKASWLEQNIFPIESKVIIGRDASCDITLPLEHLSRKHLELELRSGHLFVKDLDSSNGTFLNGIRVKESEVKAGDKIKLDVLTFEVSAPAHDPNKTIIRTAPTPTSSKTSTKKPAVKTAQKPASKPATKKSTTPNGKKKVQKRLAAEGKQDWISKDGQAGKPQKSKTGIIILMTSALIILGLAGVFLTQ